MELKLSSNAKYLGNKLKQSTHMEHMCVYIIVYHIFPKPQSSGEKQGAKPKCFFVYRYTVEICPIITCWSIVWWTKTIEITPKTYSTTAKIDMCRNNWLYENMLNFRLKHLL